MKIRYETLDFFRGLAIIGMIMFHLLFDLYYIFGVDVNIFDNKVALYWQSAVCIVFMVISGAVSRFSKKLLKRGLMLFGLGLILSLISSIFFSGAMVVFGILHFFGLAMIITSLIKPFINKMPNALGMLISIILFILTRFIYYGYVFLPFFGKIFVPSSFYKTEFLFFLGLPEKGFFSSDYYPLMPWYFIFLTGYFGFNLIIKRGDKRWLHFHFPVINFIGKKALFIYIIHQPIILIICTVLFDKIL